MADPTPSRVLVCEPLVLLVLGGLLELGRWHVPWVSLAWLWEPLQSLDKSARVLVVLDVGTDSSTNHKRQEQHAKQPHHIRHTGNLHTKEDD